MNLIEEVQKASGHVTVQKIDPNTQAPQNEDTATTSLLAQAAVPVILTGLYKYTRTEDNAQNILRGNNSTNTTWTDEIFGSQSDDVVSQVASYAHVTNDKAEGAMDAAAQGAIQVVNKGLGEKATPAQVSQLFKDNRTEILKYLPPALQLGYLINDNTIDDRTNKMEGPMSGIMHTFEKIFSDSDANDSSKQ